MDAVSQKTALSLKQQSLPKRMSRGFGPRVLRYSMAAFSIALTTAIIKIVHADSSIVNVPMLYLLAVQAVAFWFGSGPAVAASFMAFLAFDWFYVEPIHQFTVRDPFEFVALCVFLVTAITIGQLTALFHSRAEDARRREVAASALAEASWTVASELDTQTALNSVLKHLTKVSSFKQAAILIRNEGGTFEVQVSCVISGVPDFSHVSNQAIEHVLSHGTAIGWDGSPHWSKALGVPAIYIPVILDGQCAAILFVELDEKTWLNETEQQVMESIINHIAVVLQRDRLVKRQAHAQALLETDKLKTALLQMVSHDFRSPLASIKASVSSLYDDGGEELDSETKIDLLDAIDSEVDRLNKMIGNILDLSRLEAGAWSPRREITEVADLVGATLDSFSSEQNRRIKVNLESSPREVFVDPVQIVQALKNLLENALKYSTPDTFVEFEARALHDDFVVRILDRGVGLPSGEEERIFDPFYRAPVHRETSKPGIGMGLAISRGLIEAHGAKLSAHDREGGGAVFEAVFPCMLKLPTNLS